MRQRRLGDSGLSVSAIGLGGVEFGPEDGDEPDVEHVARVIETAADHGINWLDTSENYYATRNEEVIGAALATVRAEVMVATKVAPGTKGSGGGSGFRADQVRAACHASLQRLRREHIDLYLLHWPDGTGCSGRHTAENAEAADIDLGSAAESIERLVPLGPSFS